MNNINFKELTSLDIYNQCMAYVKREHEDATHYRLALHELKERGETELLYSIALNILNNTPASRTRTVRRFTRGIL